MNKQPFKFELGDEVKDALTGYLGTVTFRVQYLTGCNQYGITAKPDPKKVQAEKPEERQMDEHRLEATGKVFTLPGDKAAKKNPGGPAGSIRKTGGIQRAGRIR